MGGGGDASRALSANEVAICRTVLNTWAVNFSVLLSYGICGGALRLRMFWTVVLESIEDG